MAELTYLSFDLWIWRTAEGYLAKGWDSHGREATTDFRIPFSEPEIEGFWRRIGLPRSRARRHAAAPDASDRSRRPDLAPQTDKSFGGSLFEALFHGGLRSCFRDSLEQARRERAGLRIRLRLADVPELANLPWEYLYDGSSDRFFALSVRTPVVRYLELPEPLQKLTVRPPLKMLVMVASPNDYPELDAEQEWRRLNEALGDYQQRGLIQLERLEGATLAALQRRLRRGGAHIFHFIGHGHFDQQSQKGALILEDESGRGLPVSAEDLGIMLHDHAPRLVVLNACEGARTSQLNPFAGVAQTLIRQGVPAVVAMQTEVLDDFALTLAHEFYGALADGLPVDACLAEARKFLAGQQCAAWGTPVLYLRASDGRILDLEPPGAGDRTGKPAGAMSWLKWAAAAALAFAVFLLLVYRPWRESPIDEDPIPAELSEAESPEESAAGATPPAAEDDRVAEGSETKTSEPMADGSDRAAKSPDAEEPASADDPGTDARPTAPPELRPTQIIATPWPHGDRQQNLHRNERDGQYYVWIPEGSFRFGCSPGDDLCEDDEKPLTDQKIERGFWLGRTEVTVGAYKQFRDHPSLLPPVPSFNADWRDEVQPMVNVSRAEAEKFCAWAAARLPTEIEWEYAARAGERRALPSDVSERAWFADQSDNRVHAVSQKEPNAFGLYDMLGNASEWVAPRPDQPADTGFLRGGSWLHPEQFLRFSFRLSVAPNERDEMFGF
ncbi:MAG: SUMF1/EgtB/PvdO family nonheme iron enzyme, partial [Thermoanaerobaculia bacterium]